MVLGMSKCNGWTMQGGSSDTEDVSETHWCEGGLDVVVVVVWISDTTCSEVVVSEVVCGGEFGCCLVSKIMLSVHSSKAICSVCVYPGFWQTNVGFRKRLTLEINQ